MLSRSNHVSPYLLSLLGLQLGRDGNLELACRRDSTIPDSLCAAHSSVFVIAFDIVYFSVLLILPIYSGFVNIFLQIHPKTLSVFFAILAITP